MSTGSLNITGPCYVGNTGSYADAQSQFTIGFRFKVIDNSGLVDYNGIPVITWMPSGYSGVPFATYQPWDQYLVIKFYGQGQIGTYSQSIPIQVGTEYHIALVGSPPTVISSGMTGSIGPDPGVVNPGTGGYTPSPPYYAPSGNPAIYNYSPDPGLEEYDLITPTGGSSDWTPTSGSLPAGAQCNFPMEYDDPPTTTFPRIWSLTQETTGNTAVYTGPITVTRGAWQLYVNGVPYGSSFNFPFSTYAYTGLRFGGQAGSGIATNFNLQDVAAFTFALTPTQVLDWATGTAPTSIGAGPAAWWPLYGTTSAHPAVTDAGMLDASGNGNDLTLISGSLSNMTYAPAIGLSSPAVISAEIMKSGMVARFGACQAQLGETAYPPIAFITAVYSDPTIYRNGTSIQITPSAWWSTAPTNGLSRAACVHYNLLCGSVLNTAVVSGGSGYVSPVANCTGVVFGTPTVAGGVITYIPVVSSVDTFVARPTITITDTGGGTGADVRALMSGVLSSDVMTYSAGSSWFEPSVATASGYAPLGGIQAVTGAAMDNWTGQLEGASGGLAPTNATPTMKFGFNRGSTPTTPDNCTYAHYNWMFAAVGWQHDGGGDPFPIIPYGQAEAGAPQPWSLSSSPILDRGLLFPTQTNNIDGKGARSCPGIWGLYYNDANINTSSMQPIWLSADSGSPVNLSGPNVGTQTPTVIPSGNVTISGGVITAISLAGVSDFSSGNWEGAIALAQGGAAAITIQCSGGNVTGSTIAYGGSGITSGTGVDVWGLGVSGSAVSANFNLTYSTPLPSSNVLNVFLNVGSIDHGGGTGQWTITDVRVTAPDSLTGGAQSAPDPTKPYLANPNIKNSLTAANGNVAGPIRNMDVDMNTGGGAGSVMPTDRLVPQGYQWAGTQDLSAGQQAGQQNIYATAMRCMFWATDPAMPTYSWYYNRIYSLQGLSDQQDPSYMVTATFTSGSNVVSAVSEALMRGAQIACSGYVPTTSGTVTIDRFQGSASWTMVDNRGRPVNALASGTVTGGVTITDLPYMILPAGDNGAFAGTLPFNGGTDNVVMHFEFDVEHGMTTGSVLNVSSLSSSDAVPITYCSPDFYPGMSQVQTMIGYVWVTGPKSMGAKGYINAIISGAPATDTPQTINSTSKIAFTSGWSCSTQSPDSNVCEPVAASIGWCADLGADVEFTIPGPCGPDLIDTFMAEDVIPNMGATNRLQVSYANEPWNTNGAFTQYWVSCDILASYLTAGTSLMGGSWITDGRRHYYDSLNAGAFVNQMYAESKIAASLFARIKTAWTTAGLDPSRLLFIASSGWGFPFKSWATLGAYMESGFTPDRLSIASYFDVPGDQPVLDAWSPLGSTATAQGWPMAALNDLARSWGQYSWTYQNLYWAPHAMACRNFGQPMSPTGFTSNTGEGALGTGGSLTAAGAVTLGYTWCDGPSGTGLETTLANSRSTTPINASGGAGTSNVPIFTMPAWPTWAESMVLYMTYGPPGTETYYSTIERSTYLSTGALQGVLLYDAQPADSISAPTRTPPSTNLAASHTPKVPSLCNYEGGYDQVISEGATYPGNNYVTWELLASDSFSHPSRADVTWSYAMACQVGNQAVLDSGAKECCYFMLIDTTGEDGGWPTSWIIMATSGQVAGDGMSTAYQGTRSASWAPNKFNTYQGGAPADGANDHYGGAFGQGNTSPALLGVYQWLAAMGGSPTPTPTRRALPGLHHL